MGYSTYFTGRYELNKELDNETFNFLKKLNETRRMKRDMKKIFPEMTDEEILNKYGFEGEFYVDGKGYYGQDNDPSVIEYNYSPKTQPGLWCQWIPTEDNMGLEWDGGEKAYDMEDWLKYIIDKILAPRGYVLNGDVEAQGEDTDDRYRIVCHDNEVKVVYGRWMWDE